MRTLTKDKVHELLKECTDMTESQIANVSRWEGIAILQQDKFREEDPADSTGEQEGDSA